MIVSRACLALAFSLPLIGGAAQLDIFAAVRERDVSRVQQAIAEGADVNTRDDEGRTPLHIATDKESLPIVQELLKAGALPILTDWRGVTPLALAEAKNNQSLIAVLKQAQGTRIDEAACELSRLRSDAEKGTHREFLEGHPVRVREAVLDALEAMGFVLDEDSVPSQPAQMKHLEVRRMNPDLAGTGGGAGGERAVVDFDDASENGRSGVSVSMDTKKGIVGRGRQHNWSVPVLKEAQCLLSMLGHEPLPSEAPVTPSVASASTVVLPDGTLVKLRLYRFINSTEMKQGSQIPFVVMDDVAVDGAVLIRRRAIGHGSITSLENAANYGRQARFRFQADSVRAADGQDVRLRTAELGAGRRTAATTAANAAMMRLWGLWLKGNEKGIRAGMVVVGYVDGEREIRVTAPAR